MATVGQAAIDAAVRRLPKPGASRDDDKAPPRARSLVHLWSPNTGIRVTARHAAYPQVIQERAGGWEQRPRPGQVPRTWRPGSGQLLKIRLVLLLDGWETQRSIQEQLDCLRLLGYRDPSKGDARIQIIGRVSYASGGLRDEHAGVRPDWVIDDLDIVDELFRVSDGVRLRSTATVDLLEYVPGNPDVRRAKAKKATKKKWLKGDTLAKFTKRHLGAASKSDLIRKANPTLNAKGWSKVAAGTLVVVPAIED